MTNNKIVFWYSNCLNISTRPRIIFNDKGYCNVCPWAEEKKSFVWESRENE